MNKYKKRLSDKFIRFSIGAKLVTIITILVLVSLGSITFLVSFMVRQDLELSAEENNFEVNRRSAAEAEYTLTTVRSNSQMLIQIMDEAGVNSALSKKASDFFFEQNRQAAAIVFTSAEGAVHFFINRSFFNQKNIDDSRVESYYIMNNIFFRRALGGETLILNAAPHFSEHLLAMFCPMQNKGAFLILFAPENLSLSFSSGINETYLINNDGDLLVHADKSLIMTPANFASRSYVSRIRSSHVKNMQELYEAEGKKYFIAYTKLGAGASIVVTSIEYEKIFEGIDATTRRNLYLSAVILFFSILFIWLFSKSISNALKALSNAAIKIESGIFEFNLKPKSRDEIGYLTANFQRMSAALGIFGRFTNREIAIKTMCGEIKPGGTSKHATLFFSGIRGFSEKSENFTNQFGKGASDRIVCWLNEYLTQMVACVEKNNGVVDKFIGDAVMAHWGTAYTAGTPAKDAFNCVKTALMMRKALVIMNKNRKTGDPDNPPINIGCGIHTGVVTAGQIGSDLHTEYTVIGDPVNLASRIEVLNKHFGTDILISEDTWKLVNYFFITEEMPPVSIKGKEKPVRLFAVINHISITSGPRTLDEVRELMGIKPVDISTTE